MTGPNYLLLFLYSLRNLSPFSIYPLQPTALLFLLLKTRFWFLKKTSRVSMEGKKLVDIIVVRLHDTSAQLVEHADINRLLSPWRCTCTCVPVGEHYSQGDIIHSDTSKLERCITTSNPELHGCQQYWTGQCVGVHVGCDNVNMGTFSW